MEMDLGADTMNILQILNDGLYIVDTDMRILFWNKKAEEITGYSSEEVIGKRCSDNILNHVDAEGTLLCGGLCPLAHSIFDQTNRSADIYLHHKEGHRVPISVRTSIITDDQGKTLRGIELFTDLTNRSATELRMKEMERLMLLDPLTRLANRMYIEREISSCLEEFRRYHVPFGVMFFDIDTFKTINDTYGHLVGDQILQHIAKTLQSNARPFDLFGRWGGDEFIGILRNIDQEGLFEIANRFKILISNSFIMVEDQRLSVTVSIGATLITSGDSRDTVMERSDALMYQSKQQGRDRLTIG